MAYPFPFVADPLFGRQRQAQENPYYILRRFGFWERVYSYEHGGASDYRHREETTVGLTTTNARTVEDTTSISVSAEASFGFRGAGASLSTTISRELRVTTTHEEVTQHSRVLELIRDYRRQARDRGDLVPQRQVRPGTPQRERGAGLDHPQPQHVHRRRLPPFRPGTPTPNQADPSRRREQAGHSGGRRNTVG